MYDRYYGLATRPFKLSRAPQVTHESPGFARAVQAIEDVIDKGGAVAIRGEEGVGKSTLLDHIAARIEGEGTSVALVKAEPGIGAFELAARAFGLKDGEGSAQAAFRQFVAAESQAGRRVVLMIDDAHLVYPEGLHELIGADPRNDEGLRVVLAGGEGFAPAAAQEAIASHELSPLDPSEVADYVREQLVAAGWDAHPQLEASLFEELHHATRGLPRRINQVMNRLLLLGAIEERERIGLPLLRTVLHEMAFDPSVAPMTQGRGDTPTDRLETALRGLQGACPPTAPQTFDPVDTARLDAIERRLDEHEEALRRVLAMLIDWAEQDAPSRAA